MIRFDTALDLIEAHAGEAKSETVALGAAVGRFLAEDIQAGLNLPPFRNSAMDGFALKSGDVIAGETYPIGATLAAGEVAQVTAPVIRIMTGAAVPPDYDTVVPVEQAEVSGQTVRFAQGFTPGAHIRHAGEDVAAGETVLAKGARIGPESLSLLAALGVGAVRVYALPEVHVFSTGNELSAGGDLTEAMIHNANGPYLLAAARRAGLTAHDGGIIRDAAQNLIRAIEALPAPSLIITTGAVSKGEKDFVPEALKALGAEIVFHRVSIKPGKPILFARLPQGHIFFGLPGNPVATAVGWRFFVQAWLRRLTGRERERPLPARLSHAVSKPHELTQFLKARFDLTPDGLVAEVLEGQESFRLKPLAQGHGYVVLPESARTCAAGDAVAAFVYQGEM